MNYCNVLLDGNQRKPLCRFYFNSPNSKFSPWATVEFFNDLAFGKVRLQGGCDYTLRKQHRFSLFYRYQNITGTDADGETNTHLVGAAYTFKF